MNPKPKEPTMFQKILPTFALAMTLAAALALLSCGRSSTPSGASADSPIEKEARQAAQTELDKHWTKTADGYVTARDIGSSFAPFRYVRQAKDISIDSISPDEVTDTDKLNGIEWAGEATFKSTPVREAGESGPVLDGMANQTIMRPRGRWSQWLDYQPESIRLQKVKGQWQIQNDTWLLRGTKPTPADYNNAGVK